jgi:5'-3' exonuclease
MGIHDFTKCFKAARVVKLADYAGQTCAVDAMGEIWRAALGAKSVAVLTDADGKPTLHISVILANIAEFKKHNISQIWVFDHSGFAHNPAKLQEQAARRANRQRASRQIKQLADFAADNIPRFESRDFTSENPEGQERASEDVSRICHLVGLQGVPALEKRAFSVTREMIEDIRVILDALAIPWIEAPAGFEAEALCCQLTTRKLADWVYSQDTDTLAFGAQILVRRNIKDKLYYEYTREDVCEQIGPGATLADLRRVAVILGCDFCPRTPGIGPLTVKKKYSTVTLTTRQTEALAHYAQAMPAVVMPPPGTLNIELLTDWLVEQKNFNRARVVKILAANPKPTRTRPAARPAASPAPRTIPQQLAELWDLDD